MKRLHIIESLTPYTLKFYRGHIVAKELKIQTKTITAATYNAESRYFSYTSYLFS